MSGVNAENFGLFSQNTFYSKDNEVLKEPVCNRFLWLLKHE